MLSKHGEHGGAGRLHRDRGGHQAPAGRGRGGRDDRVGGRHHDHGAQQARPAAPVRARQETVIEMT